jgi:hypothetical protein
MLEEYDFILHDMRIGFEFYQRHFIFTDEDLRRFPQTCNFADLKNGKIEFFPRPEGWRYRIPEIQDTVP